MGCRNDYKNTTPAERFWSKVDKNTSPNGCWLWLGRPNNGGYGSIHFGPRSSLPVLAHRYAYEALVGPIPEGLTIDHRCRNRACVNPAHMELVTHRINVLRGIGIMAQFAAKTHCPKGHPYDLFNTYYRSNGGRECRVCRREKARELRKVEELTRVLERKERELKEYRDLKRLEL